MLLGVVHGFDHHDDQIGRCLQLWNFLDGNIGARLAQAAGIEKTRKQSSSWGRSNSCHAGAGPEANTDFGAAAAREA